MDDYSTPEGCLAAVQKNGNALRQIPESMKTFEICLAAVQNDGTAFEYVPEHMLTLEIWLAAVEENPWMFEYFPQDMMTYEMCYNVITRFGYALKFVPESLKTYELCFAAILTYGSALCFVPEHIKSQELCFAAIQNDGYALEYVPAHLQTDEIVNYVTLHNLDAAQFIKPKNVLIIFGTPKQMPEKAYDTLELGYDDQSAIQNGELMVDFHDEFKYGRFYRKKTFEDIVLDSKKNPTTRKLITEYTIYQAAVSV